MSISYRRFRDSDETALESLLKNTFPSFRGSNQWSWKYRQNPKFDESLLVIAERDGKLIGSNYWLLRDLKLSSAVTVRAALAADIAVYPDCRGQGIGTELIRFPRQSGAFKERGILMSYMFGRPELNESLYRPAAGYIIAPNSTITYRRHFNCQELREKFQEINHAINSNGALRDKLKEVVMCISFKLRGAPEFTVHIEPENVYLEEGKLEESEMFIEGSLPLSFLIFGGEISSAYLFRSWITGKINIRKGFHHIFKLRKAFILFQAALREKRQH